MVPVFRQLVTHVRHMLFYFILLPWKVPIMFGAEFSSQGHLLAEVHGTVHGIGLLDGEVKGSYMTLFAILIHLV